MNQQLRVVLFLTLFILQAIAAPAAADNQVITAAFSGFDATNIQALQVNGDAARNAAVLRLTPAVGNKAGSAFWKRKVSLANDRSFSAYFTFVMGAKGSAGGGLIPGADGLVFTIQPESNTAGSAGGGLGFQDIENSFGVEFDTFQNVGFGDPNGNHIGIDLDGSVTSVTTLQVDSINAGWELDDGATYHAWVDYDGTTDTLEVRLNRNDDTRPVNPNLSYTIDLSAIYPEDVYIGFTAATGGAWETHDIESFYFNNDFIDGGIDLNTNTYEAAPFAVDLARSAASIAANSGSVTLTATVTDESSNGLASKSLAFETNLGTLSLSSGVTNGSGQKAFTISSAVPGTATIRASAFGGAYGETTVTFSNAAPVITEGAVLNKTISQGGVPDAFDVTLHATDANSHTITWFVKTNPSHGTASADGTGNSKRVSYLPQGAFTGSDSFQIEARDAFGGSDRITINVTVEASPDSDGDGLTDYEESALGTNPNSRDSDGDGVSDTQEQADGTNPLERGSALNGAENRVCSGWSSAVPNSLNIFELVNHGIEQLSPVTQMYNATGKRVAKLDVDVKSKRERDLAVHDLPTSWKNDQGAICASYDGTAGDLSGRVVHYRLANNSSWSDGAIEYAFSVDGNNGISGKQYLLFNTSTPSGGAAALSDTVTNWVEVTNLSTSEQSGRLRVYSKTGALLANDRHTIVSKGTKAIPIHTVSATSYGLAIWVPESSDARFFTRLSRYVYAGQPEKNIFRTAATISGFVASGEQLAASIDKSSAAPVLEVANASSAAQQIIINIHEPDGERTFRQEVSFAPYETRHIALSSLLNKTSGIVVVDGTSLEGVAAAVVHYAYDAKSAVRSMYAGTLRDPVGTALYGSINTNLGQSCVLRLSNVKLSPKSMTLAVRNDSGKTISSQSITVPAKGMKEVNICALVPSNSYGTVKLSADSALGVNAEILRSASDKRYQFITPMFP